MPHCGHIFLNEPDDLRASIAFTLLRLWKWMWCVFPGWCLTETLLPITVNGQCPDRSSSNLNEIAGRGHQCPRMDSTLKASVWETMQLQNGQFSGLISSFHHQSCCSCYLPPPPHNLWAVWVFVSEAPSGSELAHVGWFHVWMSSHTVWCNWVYVLQRCPAPTLQYYIRKITFVRIDWCAAFA